MVEDSMEQFKATFIVECCELLEDMESRLITLTPENATNDDLNAIFRCAHSIKGGAGALGFTAIAKFTHILEALLDAMRSGKNAPTTEIIDILLKSADVVSKMVAAARDNAVLEDGFGQDIATQLELMVNGLGDVKTSTQSQEIQPPKPSAVAEGFKEVNLYQINFKPHPTIFNSGNEPTLIIRELGQLGKLSAKIDIQSVPYLDDFDPKKCYVSWVFDLETECSEAQVNEVFEFVEDECELKIELIAGIEVQVVKEDVKHTEVAMAPTNVLKSEAVPVQSSSNAPTSNPNLTNQQPSKDNANHVSKNAGANVSIRVDIDKIDKLVNMVGELVITQSMLYAQAKNLPIDTFPELLKGIDELSQHSRELQEAVMSVRMQPVKSIFSRMQRLVRDLSHQLEKNIKLELKGENTEVDKTVIEQLSDPLTHMIRNSVDHGIEKPADRIANGKPAQGTIKLSAAHRGGKIIIEIEDNGAGINRERVLQKAIGKGLIAADATLSNEEIDQIIFLPGLSTAETVSNISGRGVGMDVVRRNIEGIGGRIEITNSPGMGSKFMIILPLTLAILDGMIIRVGQESYIIPIVNILETFRPKKTEIYKVAENHNVVNIRGEIISVFSLASIFDISLGNIDSDNCLIILLENGKERFGLIVDELIGQQQVVIKSIEQNSNSIEGISGATILGDGKVSLILDVTKLMHLHNNKHTILINKEEKLPCQI